MIQPTSVLSGKHITVQQGQKKRLNAMTFAINEAQHCCIIGPNGAGKSSFINMLCGELPISAGTLYLGGQAFSCIDANARARMLGVLPQNNTLHFPFAVREVVGLGRTPYKCSVQTNRAIVDTLLHWLDLTHLADTSYLHLSGGQKQRVHIARVIAQIFGDTTTFNGEKKILLLDEPTAALDLKHQKVFLDRIGALQQAGLTLVSVVHDLNLAGRIADSIIAIKQGHIVLHDTPNNVMQKTHIEQLYGVAVQRFLHPVTQQPFITFE